MSTYKEKGPGIATSMECPRAGYANLYAGDQASVTIKTNCKTWSCIACRERVKAVVKARIETGCSTLGHSWLITVTYRMGEGAQRHAPSVQTDWTALLRSLKKTWKEISWFKIIEATKQNQPHLHLVVGNVGPKTRVPCCAGSKDTDGRCRHRHNLNWLRECKSAEVCIEHEWARIWYELTKDSFVVDARAVDGPAGAAAYLTKYLTKAMSSWEVLEGLGFARRWSRSRNWPGGYDLKLAHKDWRETTWVHKDHAFRSIVARSELADNPLAEREGTPFAFERAEKVKKKVMAKRVKGVLKNANVGT